MKPLSRAIRRVAASAEIGRAVSITPRGEPNLRKARTEIYTYFTSPGGSRLMYSAQDWVRIRLTLETAGPVSVSTREEITPVLSGKGILLVTGRETEFVLPRGDRLFIAADAIHRVSFITEPIPWLATINESIMRVVSAVERATSAVEQGAAAATRILSSGYGRLRR